MQDTLAKRITKREALTEAEIDALAKILGAGAWHANKEALRRALHYVPNIHSYGIYDRVVITPRAQYVAGQSYPDEIRTVRNCLIGKA